LCRHCLLATTPHRRPTTGGSEENTKTSAKPLDDSRMEDVTWRISTNLSTPQVPPPDFAVSTVGESYEAKPGLPGHQPLFIPLTHPSWLRRIAGAPSRSLNCRPRDSLRGEEGLVSWSQGRLRWAGRGTVQVWPGRGAGGYSMNMRGIASCGVEQKKIGAFTVESQRLSIRLCSIHGFLI
jgi:hypothetical protein